MIIITAILDCSLLWSRICSAYISDECTLDIDSLVIYLNFPEVMTAGARVRVARATVSSEPGTFVIIALKEYVMLIVIVLWLILGANVIQTLHHGLR